MSAFPAVAPRTDRRRALRPAYVVVALAASFLGQSAAATETKGWVVSWLGQAMYSQDGDCPDGINPRWKEQRLRVLADLGYTKKEIDDLVNEQLAGKSGGRIGPLIVNRGRLNGEPVNAYLYPSAVVDPKLHAMGGKYAYGFDLDGKGPNSPHAFEDPETHEKGVDHELARAFGCMPQFRGSLTITPGNWAWTWSQLKDNQPAWVITLTGEDLSKDGDVTIAIDRAIEFLRSNSDGNTRFDMTYRVDPDPRSQNVYLGKIKNGVVILREPGTKSIHLLQDPQVAPEFRMSNVQMRLKRNPDRTLEVMLGGYQPWADLYFSFASGAAGNETAQTGDIPGLYYLMKKYADAAADPRTGQNTAISATYYLTAVPAFVRPAGADKDGKVAAR